MSNYQICTRCVMDNISDTTITFDSNGYCNYCTTEFKRKNFVYFPNETGKVKLEELLEKIKKEGKNKKYDCLMGISGGLDSSYLAYLGSQWDLRILAVHIDDGFDTEISKSNIAKLANKTKFDFIFESPDSAQFNELTKAYLRANVPNIAIPQDNILFACLYRYARKYGIKWFLSGGNFALECILQQGNSFTAYDVTNIKAINRRFGATQINKLPLLSNYKKAFYQFMLGIKIARPLNYIEYNREKALQELSLFCDFEYYGNKHLENYLTKFIQTYWFYKKFGVDKRRSHLSSMIVSGQIDRENALSELENAPYNSENINLEITNILKKINLSQAEFDQIMQQPIKKHTDYPYDKITALINKQRLK